MSIKKMKIKSSNILESIVFAILVSLNIITVLFGQLNIFTSGVSVVVLIFLYSLILYNAIRKNKFSISKIILYIVVFISLFFLLSTIRLNFYKTTFDYLLNFASFGLIALYVGSSDFDIQTALRYLSYILLITFVFIGKILENYSIVSDYYRIEMGLSYAILPLVVATLLHMFFYWRMSNLINKISYFVNFYFIYLLLFFGTRGAVFSILILFTILFAIKARDQLIIINRKKYISVFIFAIVLILFATPVLQLGKNVASFVGIDIAFIEKSIDLIQEEGDLFNSRLSMYRTAWEGFAQHPVIGNGIGSFSMNTGVVYVHNIFLDLLYEGGLVLFLPFLFFLVHLVKTLFVNKVSNKNYYIVIIFLFVCSIPRLTFSASLWSVQIFWILMGYIVSKNNTTGIIYEKN